MALLEAKLLLLLLAANGAPILARWLLGPRLAWPLDAGRSGPDGRPWLGPHKTWRGLAAALLVTSLLAWLLGLSPWLGLALAALAMLGDLLASLVKRRLGIAAGGAAPLLDQLPEALLPLLVLQASLGLDWPALLRLTLGFVGLDYLLSWLLYRWHIRQRPY
jgi:CDP-2,3-bis-(O-geranylgeranyl)-sn-glycerol synthase